MKEEANKYDTGLLRDSRDPQLTTKAIRTQLERVLSSSDFKASKKVKTIFRYLTEEKFSGNED